MNKPGPKPGSKSNPHKDSKHKKMVSLRLSPEAIQRIDDLAKLGGVSKSEVIETCILCKN